MENTLRNWNSEVANLKEDGDFPRLEVFKPNSENGGQYKIKFLNEGHDYMKEKYGTKGVMIPAVAFEVEVGGKKKVWYVNKGTRPSSLFGQIAVIGKSVKNLTGTTITLVVRGKGKSTVYAVVWSDKPNADAFL